MMMKNFFILQLELNKKQNNKPLINKKVLAKVIRESNICKHAIKELKLAGYGNEEGNLGLVKKLWKKYTEAIYKYRTNTGKMTASDYTHLFGYLNPYYRSAYNIPKRRK